MEWSLSRFLFPHLSLRTPLFASIQSFIFLCCLESKGGFSTPNHGHVAKLGTAFEVAPIVARYSCGSKSRCASQGYCLTSFFCRRLMVIRGNAEAAIIPPATSCC